MRWIREFSACATNIDLVTAEINLRRDQILRLFYEYHLRKRYFAWFVNKDKKKSYKKIHNLEYTIVRLNCREREAFSSRRF